MPSPKALAGQKLDLLSPKKVLLIVSNTAISPVSGIAVGFWWSELSQAYWELKQVGYQVDIASPQGGEVKGDGWSDPDNEAGFAADDLLSRGFKHTPKLAQILANTPKLATLNGDDYDGIFLIGGQGPVVTFIHDESLHKWVAQFYETGKGVAMVCHATCILLKTHLKNGQLLAAGKSWTGSTYLEETQREDYVGKPLYPFYIQQEAKQIPETNYIAATPFQEHAIRDGNLITGQQQYSAIAVARLLIRALGV